MLIDPNDPNILQRYMPGEIALKVISDEGFYFRRIDGYPDDPTEGDRKIFDINEQRIFHDVSRKFPEITPEIAKQLSADLMRKEKQSRYIQSWFWHAKISRNMWEEYGELTINNPNCVLFTVNRIELERYLYKELPTGCKTGKIRYVPHKQAQQEAIFTKQETFKPEDEYRIVINVDELISFNNKILPELTRPIRHMQKFHEKNPIPNYFANCGIAYECLFKYVDDYGFILRAPLPSLIKDIYIPISASIEFSKKLDELLATKGYTIKCQRIKLPAE